jgi:hypothetical protein
MLPACHIDARCRFAAVISAAEAARCSTICRQLEGDFARPEQGMFSHLWPPHVAQHRGCVADCLDVVRVKATWRIAQQVPLITTSLRLPEPYTY